MREEGGVWKVRPGEVDHEIDFASLDALPLAPADESTARAYDGIVRRYVAPGGGGLIPAAAFADVPRATFLDHVGLRHGLLMAADVREGQTELLPAVVSRSLLGWDRPRHVAYRRGVDDDRAGLGGHEQVSADQGMSFGLGLFTNPDGSFGHNGAYGTVFTVYPREGRVFVLMMQSATIQRYGPQTVYDASFAAAKEAYGIGPKS